MPTTIPTTTSSDRASLSPSAGDAYFETDTKNYIIYDGTNWRGYASDGVSIADISNSFSTSFNGSSDYLNVGQISTLAGASAQTVAFWFKSPTAGVFPAWGFRVASNNQFDGRQYINDYWIDVRNGTPGNESDEFSYIIAGADMPNDINWHHFAITFDAGTVAFYIDGENVQGAPLSGKIAPASLNSTIGNFAISKLGDITNVYSSGSFDEFGMWDAALNSSNIEQLYNLGRPFDLSSDAGNYNTSADLTHWWRMGDHASDTGSGGVADGNAIINVENAANPNTNDASVGGGAPTYSSTVPGQ